jgi:hypothetical protein
MARYCKTEDEAIRIIDGIKKGKHHANQAIDWVKLILK